MNTSIKNIILFPMNCLYKLNPELDLKLLFRLKQGYKLNLSNPKTFNEKIQWIKLYDHDPRMCQCVDKYTVRDYVKQKGCGEILNNLLWQGYDANEIPFDLLPDRFVIKVTHGSTYNIICHDKNRLNRKVVTLKLNRWLKEKFLPCYGEWFYGKVRPRIIIEEYLEQPEKSSLDDYKVYCFNGTPKMIAVHVDRFGNHKSLLYDSKWKLISNVSFGYAVDNSIIQNKPEVFDQLIKYAEILSQDFRHARVDFYIIKNRIIFGEITFTDGAGFDRFVPQSFDGVVGSWLSLDR